MSVPGENESLAAHSQRNELMLDFLCLITVFYRYFLMF